MWLRPRERFGDDLKGRIRLRFHWSIQFGVEFRAEFRIRKNCFKEFFVMSKRRIPKPPQELPDGSPGWRLWVDVHRSYVVSEPQKLALLLEAGKTLNRIEQMDAEMEGEPLTVIGGNRQLAVHPLLDHAKALRGSFLAIIKSLNLPEDFGDEEDTARREMLSARGRKAAAARWGKVPRQ